jgi:hypothetical protein
MRSKILLVALAIMTSALLSAGTLDVTVTINTSTFDGYFFYSECTSTSACTVRFGQINHGNPVPPETGYPIQVTVPDSVVSGYVTVLGLGVGGAPDATTTDDGEGHVVVGLANSSFIGNPWPFATPETTIIRELESGDTTDLSAFFSANASDWVTYSAATPAAGVFGEFSTGVNVGSISTNYTPSPTVPEPATFALLGCGLAALFFVRRKP